MKDKQSLKWIYNNCRGRIFHIVILSLANIVLALFTTGLSLLSKYAIDAAQKAAEASGEAEFAHYKQVIIVMGIIIMVAITVRLVLRIFAQSLSVKVQASLEMQMKSKLFKRILCKEYDEINKYHSGELLNRLSGDISIITNGVTSIVPDMLYFISQFLGAFIVLIYFDWKFTLLFIVAGVVLSVVTLLFRKKLKYLHKAVQETDGKVKSFFQEAIESILVVKTFGVEDVFEKKSMELQQNNYDMKMKRRVVSITANAGFGFVFNLGYLFALVWCAIKVCAKTMTFGTLTAVLQLISQIQTPFVNITKVVPQYYGVIASAERIMEIENIEEEEKHKDAIKPDEFYKEFKEGLFENISFNYGRESVLEGGTVSFRKGDFVAIRGISGIGKSTLMKMLLGVFKPQEGKIKLCKNDGSFVEAGIDTRCLFSYVPQGNYLFSGTLRDNILLVNPKASDEEIREALDISDISDFVKNLPEGLDTVIGEKGLGISEGQAQRFAIARALISKAPILLLDEATSALDAETEKRVLDNIKKLHNRTCIIITHKEAALEVCNREFVIDKKKITSIEK